MKEIKFKAHIKEFNEILPILVIDFINKEIQVEYEGKIYEYDIDNKDIAIMQYTGQKDQNGIEIYEGDILEGEYYFSGVGYFDSGEGLYRIKNKVVYTGTSFTCQNFKVYDIQHSVSVIGNIYE